MLHNHLRNFTSHEFAVDFYGSDQPHDGPDCVNQLHGRFEVAVYHLRSLTDARRAVARLRRSCQRSQHAPSREEQSGETFTARGPGRIKRSNHKFSVFTFHR